jgi:hypothetical protein
MTGKQQYDWEAVEIDYRTGQKTLRALNAEYGPSIAAISRRAKKFGWVQDKSEEVWRKTRAALIQETTDETDGTDETKLNKYTQDVVDRAVQTNIQVVRKHRTLIKRTISFAERLLAQVEEQKKLDPKVDNRVFLSITQGLAKIVPLDRQAFNINGSRSGVDPVSEILDEVAKRAAKLVDD